MDETRKLLAELYRCADWIEAALDEGGNTHSLLDIVNGVLSGHFQLWPAVDACAVTEVVTYPNCQNLHIFLAGGNKARIVDMHASAEAFARQIGCAAVTIAGRRGWARELRHLGYEEMLTTVVKRLDKEDNVMDQTGEAA